MWEAVMTVRNLGSSTFSFMWQEPALVSLRRLKACDLNGFDIILAPGHLWPDELDSSARHHLKMALKADDISVDSLNLPPLDYNICSPDHDARRFAILLYEKVFALARDLEIRKVVVVPGRVSALLPPALDQTMDRLADSFGQFLKWAERDDQEILLETHPLTPIASGDAVEAFIKRLNSPRLRIAYDVANAEFIGEDQPATLKRIRHSLGQVHLSDGTRTRWRHDPVGAGTVDFAAVMKTLDEIEFQGVTLLEIIAADAATQIPASMKALRGGT
jgi:L-ribulose-5-phosphate 3-epimerase